MRKRRLVIKCKTTEACLELLNKITEDVSSRFLKSEVKGNALHLEVLGMPYELKEIKYEIEALKKEIERKYLQGRKYVKIDEISKLFRGTISIDVLLKVLKFLGYPSWIEGGKLYTNAPMELLEEIIEKYVELQKDEVVRFKLSKSTKNVILTISLATGASPKEVLDAMVRENLVEEGPFRYQLKENAELVINKLMKLFKTQSPRG